MVWLVWSGLRGTDHFVFFQMDILRTARELGIAVVAYSPLGRGFLSGRFSSPDELDPRDFRRSNPRFTGEALTQNQRLAAKVRDLAEEKGCTPGQLALAWVLARGRARGRSVLRALVTVPLVLPPVVGGVALFAVLGRRGLVGQWLDQAFGLTIPFTTAAVVIAETFVALIRFPCRVCLMFSAVTTSLEGELQERREFLNGKFTLRTRNKSLQSS